MAPHALIEGPPVRAQEMVRGTGWERWAALASARARVGRRRWPTLGAAVVVGAWFGLATPVLAQARAVSCVSARVEGCARWLDESALQRLIGVELRARALACTTGATRRLPLRLTCLPDGSVRVRVAPPGGLGVDGGSSAVRSGASPAARSGSSPAGRSGGSLIADRSIMLVAVERSARARLAALFLAELARSALIAREVDGAGGPAPSPNAPVPNAPVPNALRPNAFGPNAPVPNALRPNALRPNALRPNAFGPNASGSNASGSNASGSNAAGSNASGSNASGPNAPSRPRPSSRLAAAMPQPDGEADRKQRGPAGNTSRSRNSLSDASLGNTAGRNASLGNTAGRNASPSDTAGRNASRSNTAGRNASPSDTAPSRPPRSPLDTTARSKERAVKREAGAPPFDPPPSGETRRADATRAAEAPAATREPDPIVAPAASPSDPEAETPSATSLVESGFSRVTPLRLGLGAAGRAYLDGGQLAFGPLIVFGFGPFAVDARYRYGAASLGVLSRPELEVHALEGGAAITVFCLRALPLSSCLSVRGAAGWLRAEGADLPSVPLIGQVVESFTGSVAAELSVSLAVDGITPRVGLSVGYMRGADVALIRENRARFHGAFLALSATLDVDL